MHHLTTYKGGESIHSSPGYIKNITITRDDYKITASYDIDYHEPTLDKPFMICISMTRNGECRAWTATRKLENGITELQVYRHCTHCYMPRCNSNNIKENCKYEPLIENSEQRRQEIE